MSDISSNPERILIEYTTSKGILITEEIRIESSGYPLYLSKHLLNFLWKNEDIPTTTEEIYKNLSMLEISSEIFAYKQKGYWKISDRKIY